MTKDKDVIMKDKHKLMKRLEDYILGGLEGGNDVHQSKRHHEAFIMPFVSSNGIHKFIAHGPFQTTFLLNGFGEWIQMFILGVWGSWATLLRL